MLTNRKDIEITVNRLAEYHAQGIRPSPDDLRQVGYASRLSPAEVEYLWLALVAERGEIIGPMLRAARAQVKKNMVRRFPFLRMLTNLR
jgi:hypothetical protein